MIGMNCVVQAAKFLIVRSKLSQRIVRRSQPLIDAKNAADDRMPVKL